MKKCYVPKRFQAGSQNIIAKAQAICDSYAAQGYDLTLRQLYYQFVSRSWIANKQTEYDRLGSIINDARLAGLIDWDHLTDRTRNLQDLMHFADPTERIEHAARAYRTDLWADQDYYVEVWVEKEALAGIVERVAQRNDVPFFSCRGYVSQSEMHSAGLRLKEKAEAGQSPVIIHLGDHDPSGIDMTRDIASRLALFMTDGFEKWGDDPEDRSAAQAELQYQCSQADLTVKRIALNMDQIRRYNPPPNPAKLTDSRCQDYIGKYGMSSWELDALDPATLGALIQATIDRYRDKERFNAALARQEQERELLTQAGARWEDVCTMLRSTG